MATFSDMEIDPTTGLAKVKNTTGTTGATTGATGTSTGTTGATTPQLPYMDANGNSSQLLQYKPQASPTTAQLDAGNNSVMGAAQQSAIAQSNPNDSITAGTQKLTQSLLNNPNQGYDPTSYNANQLANYDQQQQQQVKQFKQQNGDMGGAGEVQQNLLKTMLDSSLGRSNLDNTLNMQAIDKAKQNTIDALTQGRDQTTSQDAHTQAAISNLLNTRNAYESTRAQDSSQNFTADQTTKAQTFQAGQSSLDRAQQLLVQQNDQAGSQALATLNGKIASNAMLTQEDFTASQNSLDNALKLAIANGDNATKTQIQGMQADLETKLQDSQQKFQSTLQTAQQSWQTGERIGTEDATAQLQALDIASKQAMQNNDLDTQKSLETQKENLQLQINTQDMDQQTKMAYLNSQLAEAKANNDVGRQEQILDFSNTQDMTKATQQFGFQKALATQQQNATLAIQKGDWANAQSLQKTQLTATAQEHDKDLAEQSIKDALEDKQITIQGQQMNYNQIQTAIAAGQLDPQTALDELKKEMPNLDIKAPDPTASQKAIDQKYGDLQYSYLKTHPGDADPADPTKVSTAGQAAFNDFFNKSLGVGATTSAGDNIATVQANGSALVGNTSAIKAISDNSPELADVSGYPGGDGRYTFTGDVPSGGFNANGTTWVVKPDTTSTLGDGTIAFIATDAKTGKTAAFKNTGPTKPTTAIKTVPTTNLGGGRVVA